LAETFPLPAKA